MSKKVKFARIIFFIILAGICIAITYKVLSWKDTITTYQSSMEMLYNTPDDTMDVVFVGNSHVKSPFLYSRLQDQSVVNL